MGKRAEGDPYWVGRAVRSRACARFRRPHGTATIAARRVAVSVPVHVVDRGMFDERDSDGRVHACALATHDVPCPDRHLAKDRENAVGIADRRGGRTGELVAVTGPIPT